MSIRVVYGLHGFNLASGGLLMSFCGSQTVTFSGIKNAKVVNISHLLGVLVLWKSRYCHVYPLRQNHDPGTLLFNCSSCLCIPSIPWLAIVWTCPLELRGHRGWSLYCTNKKWETWKGFAHWPQRSCSISMRLFYFSVWDLCYSCPMLTKDQQNKYYLI